MHIEITRQNLSEARTAVTTAYDQLETIYEAEGISASYQEQTKQIDELSQAYDDLFIDWQLQQKLKLRTLFNPIKK